MAKNYTISPIFNGQYRVTIDLNDWLCAEQILEFQEKINNINREDLYFASICGICGSVLKYKSETLFPKKEDPKKKKVMIILGNPATHSVANGMFFYSMKDKRTKTGEKKHKFWGTLESAGLINETNSKDLKEAAMERKNQILGGTASDKYLLGLTTFYSFPTSANKGVGGVDDLFKDFLKELQKMEYERLLSDGFSKNAIWIFREYTSYIYVKYYSHLNFNNSSKIEYWPLKDRGSNGKILAKILAVI